jgi:hypothetical protein
LYKVRVFIPRRRCERNQRFRQNYLFAPAQFSPIIMTLIVLSTRSCRMGVRRVFRLHKSRCGLYASARKILLAAVINGWRSVRPAILSFFSGR